jgi:hypothetical protein
MNIDNYKHQLNVSFNGLLTIGQTKVQPNINFNYIKKPDKYYTTIIIDRDSPISHNSNVYLH